MKSNLLQYSRRDSWFCNFSVKLHLKQRQQQKYHAGFISKKWRGKNCYQLYNNVRITPFPPMLLCWGGWGRGNGRSNLHVLPYVWSSKTKTSFRARAARAQHALTSGLNICCQPVQRSIFDSKWNWNLQAKLSVPGLTNRTSNNHRS